MHTDLDALADEITTLCEHLDAAEYRLLELIRQFDERAPWGLWDLKSCAHWLNWKCGIALGAAREKVRVAQALPALPRVGEAFRVGKLSYSKVRAITRIANSDNEGLLVEMALAATAAQIEKIVRKYRCVERLQAADQAMTLYEHRSLTYYWAEDGALVVNGRLTPEQGAVLIQALERAQTSSEPRETHAARRADALVALAERYLAVADHEAGSTADRYQVVVHVSAETLRQDGVINSDDPPAIEDGPVLAPDTVRRLACDAGIVPLIEAANGEALAIGRKTRTIGPALRRALKRRDGGCRFPGCGQTSFVDAHHIWHWADGGATRLDNLVLLCRHPHRLIHEGGYAIERSRAGSMQFFDPHGIVVPLTGETRFRGNVNSLFAADVAAGIEIGPDTTTPEWYGDDPDYDHVLWVMFQNPRVDR